MATTQYPVNVRTMAMRDYEGWQGPEIEMIPNAPFTSKLEYINYSRGQSSVKVYFKADNGYKYGMFMAEFMDILKNYTLENGNIPEMEWHVVKRGSNYGIARVNA